MSERGPANNPQGAPSCPSTKSPPLYGKILASNRYRCVQQSPQPGHLRLPKLPPFPSAALSAPSPRRWQQSSIRNPSQLLSQNSLALPMGKKTCKGAPGSVRQKLKKCLMKLLLDSTITVVEKLDWAGGLPNLLERAPKINLASLLPPGSKSSYGPH